MNPEEYQKIYTWFKQRPTAYRVLKIATAGLPLVTAASYGILLLSMFLLPERTQAELLQAIIVPAVIFLAGSLLRRWYNAPRPYEKGVEPLISKQTKGQSCPSRHALSAGVIAAVWLVLYPAGGVLALALALGVCVTRVLAGVHSIWDVTAGLLFGFGFGLLGMLL